MRRNDVLLGRPFEVLTASVFENALDGSQMVDIDRAELREALQKCPRMTGQAAKGDNPQAP